ncbi:DUF6624 domain-containing protein [Streptomyces scabiei]|uniref:DUF6624 domain-containing protein n=1 Tax=Streptomyces scabiei TaxID=1930 RepID=UPI0038F64CAD
MDLLRCKWRDESARQGGPPSNQAEMAAVVQVHGRNSAVLRDIIEEIGWPGRSMVGEDAAHAAWLIAQHADADPEFQRRCRDLVIEAVALGEATPQQMAYLVDRCCLHTRPRMPQVYGTQYFPGNDGLELFPVEDPAGLDDRRAAIGLEPFAEYDARIRDGGALVGSPPAVGERSSAGN